jgi:FMN-dependent NADH-azoreductase
MKILRLTSSFRGNDSMSLQLGNAIVAKFKNQNSKIEVFTKDLVKNEIPHLNDLHFTSFMTPKESLSSELKEIVSFSDNAIQELQTADIVVIDVPMYNFGIPSSLKAWIDHVARAGSTFKYTENGVEGLVKDKKVFLAIATGGIYSEGPMKEFDYTEKYLKAVLGFIGITDIVTFRVEGTSIPEFKQTALTMAIHDVEKYNL